LHGKPTVRIFIEGVKGLLGIPIVFSDFVADACLVSGNVVSARAAHITAAKFEVKFRNL
jgi:hypothetical protein